jgi:hypothetical protein
MDEKAPSAFETEKSAGDPPLADQQPDVPILIDLPSGEGLSTQDATRCTRESFVRVILFAGTAKSGKTTLIASLYLLFQKAPFAGYLFAKSETLVGFETRNYFALCASQLLKPTTPRTTIPEYLHLQVRKEDLSQPARDLLLCDLSGEDFREAKDSSEACMRLDIIRRADWLVLLIDGEKLADPKSRKRAKNDPMTLLRNCLDSAMLGQRTPVDVLFTKWDLIQASDEKDEIVGFADHIEQEFRRLFSDRVPSLRFARVAAHPFDAELPLGYGLPELFQVWAGESVPTEPFHRAMLREPDDLPEYDRYFRRQLPSLFMES